MSARAKATDSNSGPSLDKLLADIESLEALIGDWSEHQQQTIAALKSAIDDLHKEAFTRLIRTLKSEPAAMQSLKDAVSDEVVYAVLRHLELVKPSIHERLEQALDSVRPSLASHGGNVELVALEPPDTVEIRLTGACDGCPASALTLSAGVEKAIKDYCPEIVTINKAKGGSLGTTTANQSADFVSPFAKANEGGWVYATGLHDIPEAGIKSIDIGGQSVLLSRFADRVTCYQNACAHLGMPMNMGAVRNGILTCPHHGFRYALRSGECLTAPEVQLHTHAVRVVGTRVEVKLS